MTFFSVLWHTLAESNLTAVCPPTLSVLHYTIVSSVIKINNNSSYCYNVLETVGALMGKVLLSYCVCTIQLKNDISQGRIFPMVYFLGAIPTAFSSNGKQFCFAICIIVDV